MIKESDLVPQNLAAIALREAMISCPKASELDKGGWPDVAKYCEEYHEAIIREDGMSVLFADGTLLGWDGEQLNIRMKENVVVIDNAPSAKPSIAEDFVNFYLSNLNDPVDDPYFLKLRLAQFRPQLESANGLLTFQDGSTVRIQNRTVTIES